MSTLFSRDSQSQQNPGNVLSLYPVSTDDVCHQFLQCFILLFHNVESVRLIIIQNKHSALSRDKKYLKSKSWSFHLGLTEGQSKGFQLELTEGQSKGLKSKPYPQLTESRLGMLEVLLTPIFCNMH